MMVENLIINNRCVKGPAFIGKAPRISSMLDLKILGGRANPREDLASKSLEESRGVGRVQNVPNEIWENVFCKNLK